MVLVEVIEWPVRYNKVRYEKGQFFEIDPKYFDSTSMRMVGEVDKDQTDHLSDIGKPIVLNKKELSQMSIEGLKDYAKSFDISIGRASTTEGIIEKIVKAQG